ncbi:type II toxin-antitoxin system RelE/ParE family toxin [Cognataquiflexum aquatile]|uniref:type II toxin-antitoxin system RelE/ParE family toxin n=1 Tax=Cognataquiflexum aquatile TaxID=2249427 RepID=UPI0013007FBB|nr:hypothetical protein [Cognataquiflexum aquatile]
MTLKILMTIILRIHQKYAERIIDKIILKVDLLITNPKIGRKVPEFDKEFLRELIEGNY